MSSENMEHKFQNIGFWEYFNALNLPFKESKPENLDDDLYSESSFQISFDNLSMLRPMSIFNERPQSNQPNWINLEFEDYLENQEKQNKEKETQKCTNNTSNKRKREEKLKNKLNSEFQNGKWEAFDLDAWKDPNQTLNNSSSIEHDEEDKDVHDKAKKIKLQNKERAKKSRDRKKMYVEFLEQKVNILEKQVKFLTLDLDKYK